MSERLPVDWHAIVAAYAEWSDGRRAPAGSWPAGLGVNLMSPDVLGYVRAGRRTVEISTGVFLGERMLGLTVARAPDERPHEADGCFHSFDEIDEALEALKAEV